MTEDVSFYCPKRACITMSLCMCKRAPLVIQAEERERLKKISIL